MYKVPSETNYRKFENLGVLKSHTKRVMGIHFEPQLGYVYSVGEDGKLYISDSAAKSKVNAYEPPEATSLKTMLADKANQRLIIGDQRGFIYIYSIA